MLSSVRKFARSPWALVLFGLLAVALVMTMGDPLTGGSGGGGLVKAGERQLTTPEVNRRLDAQLEAIRNESGEVISRQQAAEQGIVAQVANSMIEQTVMLAYADKVGVRAGPAAVSDFLQNRAPIFKDALGRVNMAAVAEYAGQRGMTLRAFQNELRDGLTYDYLVQPLSTGITTPAILTEPLARYLGERRSFAIGRIPPEFVAEPATPTEEEVLAYYNERTASFAVPERRRISVITYSSEDFTDRVQLPDEQIKSEYERRIREFSTPETRVITEAVSTDRNNIQTVIDKVRQGQTMAAAAGSTPGVELTTRTVQPADITNEQYSQGIFSLPQGEPAGPTEVDGTWRAIEVTAITPGVATPLEQVADRIRNDVASREARRLYSDSRDTFEVLVGQGAPLEEISVEIGVPVIKLAPVDASGRIASGVVPQLLADNRDGFQFMQQANVGETTEVLEHDGRRAVLRLDEVIPSTTRPLEEVREGVVAQIMQTRRNEAVRKVAETVLARVREGSPLATAGRAERIQADEVPLISRADGQILPPTVMDRVFAMAVDESDIVEGRDGEPWIVKLTAIQPLEGGADSTLATQVREQVQQSLVSDLQAAFRTSVMRVTPPRVNDRALRTYLDSFNRDPNAP